MHFSVKQQSFQTFLTHQFQGLAGLKPTETCHTYTFRKPRPQSVYFPKKRHIQKGRMIYIKCPVCNLNTSL